jgi:hypothetical protein
LKGQLNRQIDIIGVVTSLLPGSAYEQGLSSLFGSSPADLQRAENLSKEYKRELIAYVFDKARVVGGSDPFNKKINLDDRPRFAYRVRTLSARVRSCAPVFTVFLFWTAVCLGFAGSTPTSSKILSRR